MKSIFFLFVVAFAASASAATFGLRSHDPSSASRSRRSLSFVRSVVESCSTVTEREAIMKKMKSCAVKIKLDMEKPKELVGALMKLIEDLKSDETKLPEPMVVLQKIEDFVTKEKRFMNHEEFKNMLLTDMPGLAAVVEPVCDAFNLSFAEVKKNWMDFKACLSQEICNDPQVLTSFPEFKEAFCACRSKLVENSKMSKFEQIVRCLSKKDSFPALAFVVHFIDSIRAAKRCAKNVIVVDEALANKNQETISSCIQENEPFNLTTTQNKLESKETKEIFKKIQRIIISKLKESVAPCVAEQITADEMKLQEMADGFSSKAAYLAPIISALTYKMNTSFCYLLKSKYLTNENGNTFLNFASFVTDIQNAVSDQAANKRLENLKLCHHNALEKDDRLQMFLTMDQMLAATEEELTTSFAKMFGAAQCFVKVGPRQCEFKNALMTNPKLLDVQAFRKVIQSFDTETGKTITKKDQAALLVSVAANYLSNKIQNAIQNVMQKAKDENSKNFCGIPEKDMKNMEDESKISGCTILEIFLENFGN